MFSEIYTNIIEHLDKPESIFIAALGGFILWAVKIAEHWNRSDENKISIFRYLTVHFVLFFWLPFLGAIVTIIYAYNGDHLGTILAFQVGLTSTVIIDKMIATGANQVAKASNIDTEPEQ